MIGLSRSLRWRLARRGIYRWAEPVVCPYADRLRERALDGFRCVYLVAESSREGG